jgi:hypothetical protein
MIHLSTINEIRLPSLRFYSPSTRIRFSPRSSQASTFKTPPTNSTLQPCHRSHLTKAHLLPIPEQMAKSQTTQSQSQSPPPAHAPLKHDVITTSPDQAVLILGEQFREIDQRTSFRNALESAIQAFSPAPQDAGETIDKLDETQPPTKIKRTSISRIYKKF